MLKATIEESTANSGVELDKIRTLYESIGSLVLINLSVSVALTAIFWNLVPHKNLLVWMGLLIVMVTARIAVYRSFSRKFKVENLSRYKAFLVLGSLSAGIIWGAGGIIMFVPEQLDYQLLIVMSLLCMAGGSAFSLSIYLPAFFAFVPVMLLPLAAYLFALGGSTHIGLGLVTIVFLVTITLFNLKINKSLSNAMSLRYENIELINELRDQKQEAEQANMAKSKFLAAASHDLRQPLYALTLHTAALDETERDPETQRIASQIHNSVDALQMLFEALLDISVLDAGAVEVHKSNFSLNALFAKLGDEFSPQAQQKNLELHWAENGTTVYGDSNLIEQILRNFLSNAIRYTDAGEIKLRCVPGQDSETIQVVDTGIGISKADQETIFDEFHQVGNPERDRQNGLGLGLSIVQRTAKLLGHEISVISEVGGGSTFSLAVDKENFQHRAKEPQNVIESDLKSQANSLVVVIDDDEAIRNGLQQLLILWGFDVVACTNADEALQRIGNGARVPAAIISDYRLHNNLSGLDAITTIHSACDGHIPALIVTGDTSKDVLFDLKNSGFQVLHKPVAPAKLRAFLRNLPRTPAA